VKWGFDILATFSAHLAVRSKVATPVLAGGSYSPDNGHDGDRLARPLWAISGKFVSFQYLLKHILTGGQYFSIY
jgi:hypothetical protein